VKRLCFVVILISLTLLSCSPQRYGTQIFGYFDTVVSIDGYFDSTEDFEEACDIVESTLREYDEIFDIHENGELKRLNDTKKAEERKLNGEKTYKKFFKPQ
jgi:hypothetical protein